MEFCVALKDASAVKFGSDGSMDYSRSGELIPADALKAANSCSNVKYVGVVLVILLSTPCPQDDSASSEGPKLKYLFTYNYVVQLERELWVDWEQLRASRGVITVPTPRWKEEACKEINSSCGKDLRKARSGRRDK